MSGMAILIGYRNQVTLRVIIVIDTITLRVGDGFNLVILIISIICGIGLLVS